MDALHSFNLKRSANERENSVLVTFSGGISALLDRMWRTSEMKGRETWWSSNEGRHSFYFKLHHCWCNSKQGHHWQMNWKFQFLRYYIQNKLADSDYDKSLSSVATCNSVIFSHSFCRLLLIQNNHSLGWNLPICMKSYLALLWDPPARSCAQMGWLR